jgi:hypothetical protein
MLARVIRLARRALVAAALAALAPGPAAAEPPALHIDAPAQGAVTHLPLIEVKGGAGRGADAGWDVALVLDLSESTLHPSGLDLDGDGPGGKTDPALLARFVPTGFAGPGLKKRLESEIDFEDTILAAELEAASALVARVTGPRYRTGLIGFSDKAAMLAPLGSPPAALEQALAELRLRLGEHLRGTHYSSAIKAAHRLLVPEEESEKSARQRAIVFLSDGAPSLPVYWGDGGRRPALEAAREAGLDGIRIFAFAFGTEAAGATEVLAEMAEWTDGRSRRVEHPELLVSELRELNLVDVARVAITNLTSGAPARALRLFPDGSFDALVTLAEGPNVLRIEAFAHDGSARATQRTVERLAGPAPAEDARLGQALLEELRRRTAEMEAWAEVERRRQEQRKSLVIEPQRGP